MGLPPPPTGIIDHFLHPPIGLLNPWLDGYGPYSDIVTIVNFSTTVGPIYTPHPVKDAFGVIVQGHGSFPSHIGQNQGWVSDDGQYDSTTYVPPLGEVIVQHQFLSGSWCTTQTVIVSSLPQMIMWDVALPGRIGLAIIPGVSFDLFFLRTGS